MVLGWSFVLSASNCMIDFFTFLDFFLLLFALFLSSSELRISCAVLCPFGYLLVFYARSMQSGLSKLDY